MALTESQSKLDLHLASSSSLTLAGPVWADRSKVEVAMAHVCLSISRTATSTASKCCTAVGVRATRGSMVSATS